MEPGGDMAGMGCIPRRVPAPVTIRADIPFSLARSPRCAELRRKKSGLDLRRGRRGSNDADLFLLLALRIRLRRLLVCRLGFVGGLSRLLLGARMIVAAMLLGCRPMSFRSLLVMFGSLLVHVLRHSVSLLVGGAETNVSRSRLFRRRQDQAA